MLCWLTCICIPFSGKDLSGSGFLSAAYVRNSFRPLYNLMAYKLSPCKWYEQFNWTVSPNVAAGGTVNTKSRRHDVPAKIQHYVTITRVYEMGKLLGDSFSLSFSDSPEFRFWFRFRPESGHFGFGRNWGDSGYKPELTGTEKNIWFSVIFSHFFLESKSATPL